MRWNCPHCDELVTADIDFETTKKAYVRCTSCQGAALIHPTAVLADYVRAQATAIANAPIPSPSKIREIEPEIISAAPEMAATPQQIHQATPPPPSAAVVMASAAAPPVFNYPRPPAFLMKTAETTEVEDSFAANDGGTEIPTEIISRKTSSSTIALWIAAALALGSGIYLYGEGKRALQNSDNGPSAITSLFAQI